MAYQGFKLPPAEDLFSTEAERQEARLEKVQNIPLAELFPFKEHPFRVADGEEMQQLVDSVRERGVLSPAMARPRKEGGYELISGHRRKAACEALGLTEMPVLVREMSDDEAVVLMVDSNIQREHILPSEKAFAYKMKYEAIKHQGKRSDLTSAQVAPKLSTAAIGDVEGISKDTVKRYIRLTYLIPEILQMVDDTKMAFNPAVEISYLTAEQQNWLKDEMENCQATPSLTQSRTLKKMSQEGTLTKGFIEKMLTEEKPNQRQKFFLNQEAVAKYFPPHYNAEQMHHTILMLLGQWQSKRGYNKPQPTEGQER